MLSKAIQLGIAVILLTIFSRNQPVEGTLFQTIATDRVKPTWRTEHGQRRLFQEDVSLQSLASFAHLGANSAFKFAGTQVLKSAVGVKRVRLQQTYGGYEVFGTSVIAEMNSNDKFTGHIYGNAVKNLHKYIPNPKACQKRVRDLLYKAKQLNGFRRKDSNISKENGKRIIFIHPKTNVARLAYKVEFLYISGNRVMYPVYFFDACNGKVLDSYNQLSTFMATASPSTLQPDRSYFQKSTRHIFKNNTRTRPSIPASFGSNNGFGRLRPKSKNNLQNECPVNCAGVGGNEKTSMRLYNIPPYCLTVRHILNWCRMDGTFIKVYDNIESNTLFNKNIIDLRCNMGYRSGINGAYGVANDAFYNGELFGNFYRDRYSIQALSYKPRLVVQYGVRLENAFSTGVDVFMGNGWNTFYPLVSSDIVSHELAHCLTRQVSGLIYRGMSGGISEAFSDITAVALRTHANYCEREIKWSIGETVFKQEGAMRFLDNPTRDGRSIKSASNYQLGMNVHQSSGIYNHAFYSMVADFQMDVLQAYKSFLDANINSWRPFTNFYSGACDVVQAANENGYDFRAVLNAFRKVDIPLLFCDPFALTTVMYVGESREDILVSSTRTPMVKVILENPEPKNTTWIYVESKSQTPVRITVTEQAESGQIIATGNNRVVIRRYYTFVYVKLSCVRSKLDESVKMTIM